MDEPSLQDYIAVLRRRRRVVALAVVVAIAIALAISLLTTPRYRARAELLLQRTANEEILVDEVGQVRSGADAERELNNEIELIESQTVRDAVDDQYDGPLDVDDVTASASASDSNSVVNVNLVSTKPAAAADLVNQYVDTYITTRRERRLEELLSASEEIQSRLDVLRQQITEVSQPIDEINAQVAAAPAGSPERAGLEEQRQSILAEVLPRLAPLQSRESSFRGQLSQLELSQDLTELGGVEVLAAAEEPTSSVAPKTVMNIVIGGLIGLLGGIVLAFVIDRLDDSVRSKEMVEQITGLPTLGVIPRTASESSPIDLVGIEQPSSQASEAYRLLRTSVRFLGLDTPTRTLLVTSAAASEGKTVTAANLAVALAQGGEQVLLVGADLRRPRVHELFGAPQSPGLTSALLGEATPESTAYAIEEVAGLHLMPSGPTPPNPAELLDSSRTHELFASLTTRYDRVVVDSPPVLPVTDAQVLSRVAGAVLLVVAYGETSKRGLARAIELLGQVNAPLVGTVLNLVPAGAGYAGRTYRYDTYKSRSERRRQREDANRGTSVLAHITGNGARGASSRSGSHLDATDSS
jgi:capsular exopolysaccharide synthesis family protein